MSYTIRLPLELTEAKRKFTPLFVSVVARHLASLISAREHPSWYLAIEW